MEAELTHTAPSVGKYSTTIGDANSINHGYSFCDPSGVLTIVVVVVVVVIATIFVGGSFLATTFRAKDGLDDRAQPKTTPICGSNALVMAGVLVIVLNACWTLNVLDERH